MTDRPELDVLIKASVAIFKAMTPEQRAAVMEAQRQSWVRGEQGLRRPTESASPPCVPGASADVCKVGVESGPGQPIDILLSAAIRVAANLREYSAAAMAGTPSEIDHTSAARLIDDMAAEIRRLRAAERERKVDLGGVLELLIERNGKVDLTSDVVSQVRGLLAAERRAGIEAAAKWLFDHRARLYPLKIADAIAAIRALADATAPDPLLAGLERALALYTERHSQFSSRTFEADWYELGDKLRAEIAARKGG